MDWWQLCISLSNNCQPLSSWVHWQIAESLLVSHFLLQQAPEVGTSERCLQFNERINCQDQKIWSKSLQVRLNKVWPLGLGPCWQMAGSGLKLLRPETIQIKQAIGFPRNGFECRSWRKRESKILTFLSSELVTDNKIIWNYWDWWQPWMRESNAYLWVAEFIGRFPRVSWFQTFCSSRRLM